MCWLVLKDHCFAQRLLRYDAYPACSHVSAEDQGVIARESETTSWPPGMYTAYTCVDSIDTNPKIATLYLKIPSRPSFLSFIEPRRLILANKIDDLPLQLIQSGHDMIQSHNGRGENRDLLVLLSQLPIAARRETYMTHLPCEWSAQIFDRSSIRSQGRSLVVLPRVGVCTGM